MYKSYKLVQRTQIMTAVEFQSEINQQFVNIHLFTSFLQLFRFFCLRIRGILLDNFTLVYELWRQEKC